MFFVIFGRFCARAVSLFGQNAAMGVDLRANLRYNIHNLHCLRLIEKFGRQTMELVIRQKYFTIGNKFAIENERGEPVFYAIEKIFKIRANTDIMDVHDVLLAHMEAKFMHFFSYFEISDASGKVVGALDEKMHMPFMRRAKLTYEGRVCKIKAGPIHMKVIARDAKGKWDKKHPVCKSTKKMFRVADTYRVEVDERRIDPIIRAMVALWYDKIKHNASH